ncbi:hypothetical protein ACSCB1_02590 [Streptomyces europaeiscabiei]|uniref:Secreted protein n=1 Tax=Streptomyces europaeiscabiei TaxID=146819 RepID=A0ABU4NXJ2_9ACTN|nr:hypothetical protein [Streptomyces europaeiscabiei]MDX2524700.1 hypothetical protein [Streptomyces europaeiscabiei]MDX2761021.1 hypothetical protein [Streptomyces europaeiscabiei]MDX2770805.1 hypothetical protein [Streptomyces europaeiscabiei]MDX3548382.1 hypothetical protein [Streptomyces europaeiscabiei]MDX3559246.1 hypothetical protein [Streptomyces europaeiscabiei]
MTIRTRNGRRHPALVPATLAVLTACFVAPSAPASADADPDFVKQVGLATVTDGGGNKRPAEFAVDSEGRMWEFEKSGSGWLKKNRGIPSRGVTSTQIRSGAGALGVNQGARAYVVGEDGYLWEFLHDGEDTGWARLPRPAGAKKFVSAVGTEAAKDGMPVVVVRDADKQLWQYRHGNGEWTTEHLGTIPASTGETLAGNAGLGMFRDGAYAFTVSNRNVLWSVHKTRDGHWNWSSWGTGRLDGELWSSLGVISYKDRDELRAFMRSRDGHAWRVSWDGGTGRWEDLGAPPAVPLTENGGGVNAIPTGEQVTAVGGDGKLWNTVAEQAPSAVWKRTDVPEGLRLNKELGSRNVGNDSYTFVVDSEGDLWVAKYSATPPAWKWDEISK